MASLADLAKDLRVLGKRLNTEYSRKLTTAAATAGKKAALSELSKDLPSNRLRNLGKKGAKLSAGYDLVDDRNAVVNLRPRGAWVLLDKGAKAHTIGGRKSRKGPGKRTLRIGGRVVTGPVSHPGAGGHGTIKKAEKSVEKAAPQAVAAELLKVVKL